MHFLQLALEAGVFLLQLRQHAVVVLLQGHVAEGEQILPAPVELVVVFTLVLQPLDLLLDLLGILHVVPEAVLPGLRLQLGDLLPGGIQLQGVPHRVQLGPQGVQFRFVCVKFDHRFIFFRILFFMKASFPAAYLPRCPKSGGCLKRDPIFSRPCSRRRSQPGCRSRSRGGSCLSGAPVSGPASPARPEAGDRAGPPAPTGRKRGNRDWC